MSIEAIGIIVTAAGVIVSVIALVLQMRVQIRQIKAATSAQLTDKLNDYNRLLFDHPEVYDELDQPYQQQSGDRQTRAELVLDMRFTLFDEAYTQYKKYKLLDEQDWAAWKSIIELRPTTPYVLDYWKANRPFYNSDFAQVIDELMHQNEGVSRKRVE
ncbi:MAG: hypothetical protein KIT87_25080 [Anaerolineae bacterium]|nr:hypothetical protein [Anaerolineae bacterium]